MNHGRVFSRSDRLDKHTAYPLTSQGSHVYTPCTADIIRILFNKSKLRSRIRAGKLLQCGDPELIKVRLLVLRGGNEFRAASEIGACQFLFCAVFFFYTEDCLVEARLKIDVKL